MPARSCALQLPAMLTGKEAISEPCAPVSASATGSGDKVLLLGPRFWGRGSPPGPVCACSKDALSVKP